MKAIIKRSLKHFGYEIRKLCPDHNPPDPFAQMRELISRDQPVLFDVGANVGQTAATLRGLFPTAVLHCFEPFPDSYQQLAVALSSDQNAHAYELALADRSGTASLTVNASPATNSLLPTDVQAGTFWGEGVCDTRSHIEVRLSTLDEFCARQNIDHIDVLKLDVQGAEYAVLQGGSQALALQSIDIVYMEMIMAPTYTGQRSLSDYLSLLNSFGYHLLDIYDQHRWHGRLIQADNIFVNERMLARIASPRSRPGAPEAT